MTDSDPCTCDDAGALIRAALAGVEHECPLHGQAEPYGADHLADVLPLNASAADYATALGLVPGTDGGWTDAPPSPAHDPLPPAA